MVNNKQINFYHLNNTENRMKIEQSSVDREWMNQTSLGYSYRCLPMTYANRHGWAINLLEDVKVIWDGSPSAAGTQIVSGGNQNGARFADNGTGNGVVTFHFNAIPRTSKDWNLWIMGAPNLVIPGASPLSGVIESDWMFSSPTSNWKLTEPGKLVTFKKGDPVIFFIPIHKTEMEEFKISEYSIQSDEDMMKHQADHSLWREEIARSGGEVFGKSYLKGVRTDGSKPDWECNHKTRLHLHNPDSNTDN